MKIKKRLVSWLLSGAMLLSMVPAAVMAQGPAIMPFSLMPLKEVHCTLDLTGYFPEELAEMPVRDVLTKMTEQNSGTAVFTEADLSGITELSWNSNYLNNDDFVVTSVDGTMDLLLEDAYTNMVYLELIVGKADQLDAARTRYLVNVSVSPSNDAVWDASVTTAGDPAELVRVYSDYLSDNTYNDYYEYQLRVNEDQWKKTETSLLKLDWKTAFQSRQDLTVTVYDGYYATEAELEADAYKVDVTAQIWGSNATGYEADYSYKSNYEDMQSFTVVIKKTVSQDLKQTAYTISSDTELVTENAPATQQTILVQPFVTRMYGATASIWAQGVYRKVQTEYSEYFEYAAQNSNYEWTDGMEHQTYVLESGLSANENYYLTMQMNHPDDPSTSDNGIDYVQYAVVGKYDTIEAVKQQLDIKDQLFAKDKGDGYYGNFKTGKVFTIVDTDDELHYIKISVVDGPEIPEAPDPLSQDTYFRAQGASGCNAYVMSYMDDSYYYNGYQTVFILNTDKTSVAAETITPTFYTGPKVKMSASTDNSSTTPQESGVTALPFDSGKAIAYSASAENAQNLKNYWVTYVTQHTGGAKLFVNATNNPDHYNEDDKPVREIFLDDAHDYHHDIFLANIGDAPLNGLTVTLSDDAQNIALDEYWTIGDTKTLAAFTTTDTRDSENNWVNYGEIANVAKIRLVPIEGQMGAISGTLTISADGQEPVEIELTGIAGIPKITTESLREGVKYVPYSSVIQTNNMNASDAITFTLDIGDLPEGIELKPNGELYGVPKEYGEFPITVTASYKGVEGASDTKEFTLTILDNTNENVLNATDAGYELSEKVPDSVDGTTDQIFESEGELMEFQDFWLDGEKLQEGVDYLAEEGSTKITIYAQTFKNAGNGTHTIAAEFRVNNNIQGELKRAAQNVSVSTGGGGSTSSGGGSTSSGGGSSTPTQPVKPSYSLDTNVTFDNGSVVFSKSSAKEGETVTFTVRPDKGYATEKVQIFDKNGKEVKVTFDGSKYSFIMPASKITVKASFAKLPDQVEGQPFTDILEGNWYNDAVVYVYENGIMHGTAANKFSPNSTSARAMVIMTLYNMAGRPETAGHPFVDVPEDAYYADAAAWAYANGIANGVGNGLLAPENAVSREQMAMLLYRYAKLMGLDTAVLGDLTKFADNQKVSSYALEAMLWANGVGIIMGEGNYLNPADTATRAELATMLMRFDMLIKNQ